MTLSIYYIVFFVYSHRLDIQHPDVHVYVYVYWSKGPLSDLAGRDADCGRWSAFSLSGEHADHWSGQRLAMVCQL